MIGGSRGEKEWDKALPPPREEVLHLSGISEYASEEMGCAVFKAFLANPKCRRRECTRIVELMKTGTNPHVRSVRLYSNHLGWLYFLHCYFTTLCRMELFQRKLGCHSYMSLIELYGFFKKITWCQLFIKQSTNQSINQSTMDTQPVATEDIKRSIMYSIALALGHLIVYLWLQDS